MSHEVPNFESQELSPSQASGGQRFWDRRGPLPASLPASVQALFLPESVTEPKQVGSPPAAQAPEVTIPKDISHPASSVAGAGAGVGAVS